VSEQGEWECVCARMHNKARLLCILLRRFFIIAKTAITRNAFFACDSNRFTPVVFVESILSGPS